MGSCKKVLLVDDMGGIRKAMSHLLKQDGYDVTEADNGLMARDILSRGDYDLVITDIVMPQLDGGELILWLKESKNRGTYKMPRVIAMSGGGAHSSAVEALSIARDKADAIWIKPFGRTDLKSAINRVVG